MHDDDVRSDIYFLGTLAYLALCGKPALQESRDRNVRSDPRRFTAVEPLATRGPQLPREVVDVVARMMHLDPLERWQTAADARRAVEQVVAHHAGRDAGAAVKATATATGDRPADRGSVMLVESSATGQQRLREFFTKLGYRVLLTENPQRALARFSNMPPPANCLVLSATSLGTAAVEAFNTLSSDPALAAVPAILLADGRQEALLGQAKVDDRRRIVPLPLQTEVIRSVLAAVMK
jgi:CheY-like chemotaxis protein